jgi:hypothetical protein
MSADSLDFWLGDWEVSWDAEGARQTGTNSISRVGDTIRELFNAPADGYIGASVSRWDVDGGVWLQDYWDNGGYTAIFRGTRSGDRMVLERTSTLDAGPLTRLVWSSILPDSITWDYERRREDGAWESTWHISYNRRPTRSST